MLWLSHLTLCLLVLCPYFLKKKLHYSIIISIMVCTVGVVCASLPLLGNATVSVSELIILFLGMLSYSVGAIYFSSGLSLLAINGWQTLLGGLFLLPVTFFFYKNSSNHFNNKFWLSVGWLAILVSIFAAWILKDSIVFIRLLEFC